MLNGLAAVMAGPPLVRPASGWLNVTVTAPPGKAVTKPLFAGLVLRMVKLDWTSIVVAGERDDGVPEAVGAAVAAISCVPSLRGVPDSVIVAVPWMAWVAVPSRTGLPALVTS